MRAATSSNADRQRAIAPLCLLAIGIAVVIHGIALTSRIFDRADGVLADRLMAQRNRTALSDSSPVVYLDIDDRSVASMGGATAGRRQLADSARALAAAGAAAQAYDFVFAAPRDEDPDLSSAFHAAPKVFVGAAVTNAPMADRGGELTQVHAWSIQVEEEPPRLPTAYEIIGPAAAVGAAAAGVGVLNVSPDADGVFRRLPVLFKRTSGGYFPSLALAVACAYLDVSPSQILLRRASLRLQPKGRAIELPLDESGALLLDFRGDWEWGTHYSFGEVWHDGLDPTARGRWRSALENRIVVIGDVSTGQADVGAVPVDRAYPLVGLHATAIRNIVGGTALRPASRPALYAIKIATLLIVLLAAIVAPAWIMPLALIMVAVLLLTATWALVSAHTVVGVAEPCLAVVGFAGGASAWRYVVEARERRLTRRAFEAYFSPAVVARLVASGRSFSESRHRELTVIFSDIVGFTARSSKMQPDDVQSFLNSYFSAMVAVAFRHGGTVDKFIGDGLMIFFNDPDDQPDHPARAVRCAAEMQAAVRQFSASREAVGEPAVEVRIGVHTGWAIVGALGSRERLSYTAVGAAVNLAQRLESNAPAGRVMLSAETAARLPPSISISPASTIIAKGFGGAIDVFLIDEISQARSCS